MPGVWSESWPHSSVTEDTYAPTELANSGEKKKQQSELGACICELY